jgi:hypothetical protein
MTQKNPASLVDALLTGLGKELLRLILNIITSWLAGQIDGIDDPTLDPDTVDLIIAELERQAAALNPPKKE